MLHTTFNWLKLAGACGQKRGSGEGYDKLATYLGGTSVYGKDTPISLAVVVESNGLYDALWCLRAATEDFAMVVHPFIRGYLADVLEHLTERVTFSVNMINLLNATAILLRSPDAAANDATYEAAASAYYAVACAAAADADYDAYYAADAVIFADAFVANSIANAVAVAVHHAARAAASTYTTAIAYAAHYVAEREWQTERFLAALKI